MEEDKAREFIRYVQSLSEDEKAGLKIMTDGLRIMVENKKRCEKSSEKIIYAAKKAARKYTPKDW